MSWTFDPVMNNSIAQRNLCAAISGHPLHLIHLFKMQCGNINSYFEGQVWHLILFTKLFCTANQYDPEKMAHKIIYNPMIDNCKGNTKIFLSLLNPKYGTFSLNPELARTIYKNIFCCNKHFSKQPNILWFIRWQVFPTWSCKKWNQTLLWDWG